MSSARVLVSRRWIEKEIEKQAKWIPIAVIAPASLAKSVPIVAYGSCEKEELNLYWNFAIQQSKENQTDDPKYTVEMSPMCRGTSAAKLIVNKSWNNEIGKLLIVKTAVE